VDWLKEGDDIADDLLGKVEEHHAGFWLQFTQHVGARLASICRATTFAY
jgi:hypothetical protein